MGKFKSDVRNCEDMFLKDLKSLIEIASVRQMESSEIKKPFGKEISKAFNQLVEIALRLGFVVETFDGYALDISISRELPYIGVLAHIDVVEAGNNWKFHPYTLTKQDGILYGRGVSDDKGPLLCALYAMYILKERGLVKRPIRLIVGGAEETTWECVDYYFKKNPQPIMAFSPDGNFPIVNGEKGILQIACNFHRDSQIQIRCKNRLNYVCEEVEIKLSIELKDVVDKLAKKVKEIKIIEDKIVLLYKGDNVLSRNPHKGVNALDVFFDDFSTYEFDDEFQVVKEFYETYLWKDPMGKKLGIEYNDKDMGFVSVCPMSLTWNKDVKEICIDFRYVKGREKEEILDCINTLSKRYTYKVDIIKDLKMLYVDKDSKLIECLSLAYEKVMGEKVTLLSKGGASYARVLENGVAFGATFSDYDTRVHRADENIKKEDLLLAMEIYCEALNFLSNEPAV